MFKYDDFNEGNHREQPHMRTHMNTIRSTGDNISRDWKQKIFSTVMPALQYSNVDKLHRYSMVLYIPHWWDHSMIARYVCICVR